MRVMGKGKKSNAIVTKFSLKKAQNSGGITYSQAVFSIVRELSTEECLSIEKMSEQVKAMATKVAVADEAE